MDQERFDELAKTLASGQSRRGFLKGVTGTAIGGLLASVGLGKAVAAPPAGKPSKCYGENSRCTNGKQCCSGTCTNRTCAPVDLCVNVTCIPTNVCFTAGTCDPSTGLCSQIPTPANIPCPLSGGGTGACNGTGTCITPLGPIGS